MFGYTLPEICWYGVSIYNPTLKLSVLFTSATALQLWILCLLVRRMEFNRREFHEFWEKKEQSLKKWGGLCSLF